MKRLILITGLILISCTVIQTLAAPQPATVSAAAQEKADEKRFFITEERGKIAVYRSGEAEPYLVTETVVNSLPKADRAAIRQGIEVRGEDKLRRLLEDYCS